MQHLLQFYRRGNLYVWEIIDFQEIRVLNVTMVDFITLQVLPEPLTFQSRFKQLSLS